MPPSLKPTSASHCGAFMGLGSHAQSIVVDEPVHHVMSLPKVETAVVAFLKAHLG